MWRRVLVPGVVAAVLLLSGCGGAAATLLDPTEQALAAVRSESLAFTQQSRHQLTDNALKVLVDAMTDELTSAEKTVNDVKADRTGDPALRTATLGAVRDAATASLAARDCLDLQQPCADAVSRLTAAADGLEHVKRQLEDAR